jgi:hypothetical protein
MSSWLFSRPCCDLLKIFHENQFRGPFLIHVNRGSRLAFMWNPLLSYYHSLNSLA